MAMYNRMILFLMLLEYLNMQVDFQVADKGVKQRARVFWSFVNNGNKLSCQNSYRCWIRCTLVEPLEIFDP
jgi:hypothetical protein